MKHILIISILLFSLSLFSQQIAGQDKEVMLPIHKSAITVGIGQGGGQIIGADFEQLVCKRVGIQFGVGIMGFGAAVN